MVVRKIDDVWCVLGLWAHLGFDIPKGHVEPGDDIFFTALREAEEEAGIRNLSFKWGLDFIKIDNLYVYLAATNDTPALGYNAEEGIYEHEFVSWISWSEMESKCYTYLRPAITWARQKIERGSYAY